MESRRFAQDGRKKGGKSIGTFTGKYMKYPSVADVQSHWRRSATILGTPAKRR
jgi:hypothetical protein